MNQNQLFTGFTVVSLVAMGIGFYRTLKCKSSDKQYPQDLKVQEQQISKQLDSLNQLQLILSSKAEDIELKYSKGTTHILTTDSLRQILEFTSQIVDKEQLSLIVVNNRKARRSCFSSMKNNMNEQHNHFLQTYYRFVCTYDEQLQYLIEKSQKDFVVFLNIDYSTITDSIQYYTSQHQHQFADWIGHWTTQIKEQLKEQLPLYKQPIPIAQILQIAQYQIQVLTSQGQHLKQAVLKLHLQVQEEQEAIPTFLQSFLEDIVKEQFEVQIEQTNLAATDLTPELQEKFHILSELKNSVLQGMLNPSESDHSDYQDESEGEQGE